MKPITKILFLIILVCIPLSIIAKPDDFKTVKDRIVAELKKSPIDDSQVNVIISNIKKDGSFKNINYVDLSRTGGFPQRTETQAPARPIGIRQGGLRCTGLTKECKEVYRAVCQLVWKRI